MKDLIARAIENSNAINSSARFQHSVIKGMTRAAHRKNNPALDVFESLEQSVYVLEGHL